MLKKLNEEAVTLNLILTLLSVEVNFAREDQGRDYAMRLSKARLVLDAVAWLFLIDSAFKLCR